MAVERTLALIKPDAVRRSLIGKIIAHYETEGFEVVALEKLHLRLDEARAFYAVHAERPFYDSLTERGVVIYPGRVTEEETFRVGCIGRVDEDDMKRALGAMADVLDRMGVKDRSPNP